jgi:RNA polymerase sigma factor (sigma-70 family)
MNGATAVAPEATGHPPDHELVAAVRRGDDRAFEALYLRYHPRIAAYVRGMVKDHGRAEDVTQEVFFSSLRRMRETERPIAFKPWIYEIARNACIDLFRRSSRAEELSYDHEAGLASEDYRHLVSSGPTPDAAVDAKQQLDHLRGAFGGLSETHHQILVLRELEGLSYREIGDRLGMSRPAVESTLFRARRRLTEEYDELVSGRRCQRVQAIIAEAAEGMLGARDKRRLARHLSYCQVCRREARLMGVEPAARPRTTVAAKLAALLPIPAFLRRGRGGDSGAPAGAAPSGFAVQLSVMAPMAEQAATTWSKAVAAVAAVAIAGVGAGVATHEVTGAAIPGLDQIPLIKDVAGGDSGDKGGGSGGASGTSGAGGGSAAQSGTGSGSGSGGVAAGSGARSGSGSGGAGGTGTTTGGASSAGSGGVGGAVGSVTGSLPQGTGTNVPGVSVPNVGSGGGGSGSGTPSVSTPSTSTPQVQQPNTGSINVPSTTVQTPTVSVPSGTPSVPDTSSTTLPSLGK